ncbi:MAG: metal-dependent transcriptional regulator [Dehalococcoidales bacterium]|nr:metal-dependent transcriptional regulator [Dehalococcoidales bacterium]
MDSETHATATVEEYLETILNMISESKAVLAARLSERLEVSPPTVTATLQRMARDGLITTAMNKEITLTEHGMKMAISVVKRHRLAERLLTDILKVPWHEAHGEACLLEHGISEKVMDRLYDALGKPKTCPHGNPIPADNVLPPIRGVPLDTIAAGETVVVERISEQATRLEDLMRYLGQANIKPGVAVTVKEVADYAGTMKVLVNDTELALGTRAAAMVWVLSQSGSQD